MGLRILLNDYGGYEFIARLGHALSARGHQVLYTYAGYNPGQGPGVKVDQRDRDGFRSRAIYTSKPLDKSNFFVRWNQEKEYGRLLVREIKAFQPDVIVSANNPLASQVTIQRVSRRRGIPFVFWLQDLISTAASKILRQRLGLIGLLIGKYFEFIEKSLLQQSDQIIVISSGFQEKITSWEIPEDNISLLHNWAPIQRINPRPKRNPWSETKQLADTFNYLYAGTLGMKHDPGVFVKLAQSVLGLNARVVVVAEGSGQKWLKREKHRLELENLFLFDFQPADQLQDVLGSADILLAVLTSDAGEFSVPSKIYTYMCAQRAMLLSLPADNLAARLVVEHNMGLVTSPGRVGEFLRAAETLYHDPALRAIMGKQAREYAELNFDQGRIAERFETIIRQAI